MEESPPRMRGFRPLHRQLRDLRESDPPHALPPPVLRMAKRDHWLVRPIVKTGCTPKTWVVPGPNDCDVWFQWAVGQVQALRPTVSLIIGKWSRASPSEAVNGVGAAVAAFLQSS